MNSDSINTGKTYEEDEARKHAKPISKADKKKVLNYISKMLSRKAGSFLKPSGKGFP